MEMITRRRHTNYRMDEPLLPTTVPYKQPTAPWPTAPSSPPKPSPNPKDQSCRDRTNEFYSAVRSLQSRRHNHFMPAQNNRPQKSEFTLKARCIGKDLANTFCKLEKLTLLVKDQQNMSGNPVEMGELTAMIKQDITGLNKQIAALEEHVRFQKHRHSNHQQTHSNSIVITLQSRLAMMSNDFKVVLEARSANLQLQKNPQSPQLYRRTEGFPTMNSFMQDDQKEVLINMDSSEPQKRQNQVLMEQQSHYEERADTMQSIETTIVELGSVFQRLATMVKEQEEQVHRIDSNITDADVNIELAHTELMKYLQYVSANRSLLIKIFIVLIVFFIVFIKFLA